MLNKRIIPCMDISNGRVVKGVKFEGIRDVLDPVEAAAFYNSQGADELVFYDITASTEGRGLLIDLLRQVVAQISVPLMVGGGIASLNDFERVISCGADKVSINSGAIKNPELIEQAAREYGSGRVVLSMDVKPVDGVFRVFSHGGQVDTGMDAAQWARRGQESGAGELVINSIEADGAKSGFDIEMLRAIREASSLPIVASGGAGEAKHFLELFRQTDVEAGLAASVFHFREVEIPKLKEYLRDNGIPVTI